MHADTAANLMAQLSIPGDVRSKKNSKQLGRRGKGVYVATSDAHQVWEAGAVAYLMQLPEHHKRWRSGAVLSIYIELWRGTEAPYDPDNMGTSVLDAMVAAGTIPTDGLPLVYCVRTRHAGIDRENPRAEVTIYDGSDGPISHPDGLHDGSRPSTTLDSLGSR